MRVRVLPVVMLAFAACPLHAQLWAPPGDGLPKPYGPVEPTPHVATLQDAGQAIRQGRRDGQLSRTEARHLRREQGVLDAIAERYAEDGLTPSEAADLDFRAHVLLDQVQAKRLKR